MNWGRFSQGRDVPILKKKGVGSALRETPGKRRTNREGSSCEDEAQIVAVLTADRDASLLGATKAAYFIRRVLKEEKTKRTDRASRTKGGGEETIFKKAGRGVRSLKFPLWSRKGLALDLLPVGIEGQSHLLK